MAKTHRDARTVDRRMAQIRRVIRRLGLPTPESSPPPDDKLMMRKMLADLCAAMLQDEAGIARQPPAAPGNAASTTKEAARLTPQINALSPRMRQTLSRLLSGDGEKQIAAHLGVSKHTVHVYVKGIYQRFGVCSRSELLAQFVADPLDPSGTDVGD